jgi:hypothetical protein
MQQSYSTSSKVHNASYDLVWVVLVVLTHGADKDDVRLVIGYHLPLFVLGLKTSVLPTSIWHSQMCQ